MSNRNNQMCDLENLTFPSEFFEDEVREGFFISGMMKRYWAAQLVVLSEIAKICKKHKIPWYVDYGTLIGVIRHMGFVPWDDDLDICMMRSDYTRFFEIAKKELPPDYTINTLQERQDCTNMIGRVVNNSKLRFDKEHLEQFCGCPYVVGIDIFPLDGVAKDPIKEQKRIQKAKDIDKLIDLLLEKEPDADVCIQLLDKIERENHIKFHIEENFQRELLLLLEKLYCMYSVEEADEIALMFFWTSEGNHKYPKELFKDIVFMPFENTYLPVPAGYDRILKIEYGSYMQVYKGGGVHEYPLYKEQEEKVIETMGKNLYRYTLQKEALNEVKNRKFMQEQCEEMTELLKQAHGQIVFLIEEENLSLAGELLENCQSMAITLGTSLEGKFGEGAKVIRLLENYCELIYECYGGWDIDSKDRLDALVSKIEDAIQDTFANHKKEIVFLPCKFAWWENTMKEVWQAASEDTSVNTYVIPIPYFEKDFNGEPLTKHDESELFSKDVPIVSFEDYDFEKKHPDMIVIQNPFDGESYFLCMPEYFTSKNLLQYTDKLVYLPPFDTDAPVSDKDKANAALRPLIEQPALVYAEQVILKSDKLRSFYVDVLTELAGEDTKAYWEEKIHAIEVTDNKPRRKKTHDTLPQEWRQIMEEKGAKKLLLYYTSISFLLEYKERAIEKVKDTFALFKETQGIVCVFSTDENIRTLEQINPELWEAFDGLLKEFKECKIGIYDEQNQAEYYLEVYDAYYGDGGYLGHESVKQGIPVMLRAMN